jgi:hypothetical protein
MQLEESIAKELADIVKAKLREEIQPLRIQLDALVARVSGLEATSSVSGKMDELKRRMDRLETATSKAAVVRLAASGGGA